MSPDSHLTWRQSGYPLGRRTSSILSSVRLPASPCSFLPGIFFFSSVFKKTLVRIIFASTTGSKDRFVEIGQC